MSPPYLFVYGTLRRGFRNRWARALQRGADFVGDATIHGRLYQIADYPGLTDPHGPGELVRGEVYRLRNPASLLAALDAYEGAEYLRAIRTVWLNSGRPLRVQVYRYRAAVDELKRILGANLSRQTVGNRAKL